MIHFANSITSKLPNVGTTIFSVMSQLAHKHKAINLSQGFPDFQCAPELIELVHQQMKKGHNQYAPMQGVQELREALCNKINKLYGASYSPETEINITAGATQAIFTAISALIKEGDEVIVLEPAYDCYVPAIQLSGGVPIYVELDPNDYHIPWEIVQKRITQRTKMIIINTPHNPTGSTLSEGDMHTLEKILAGTDIIVLSDEVYEHIIFDGIQHQSIARFPKLAERSIVTYSFGKTFHATGWKLGFCLAPENIMNEFRKAHQFVVYTCNTPIQYALAEYLSDENNYQNLGNFYQEKRDYFCKLVKESRFKILPCTGSYFQLLDYSDITEEIDTEYAIRLTKEAGIASIPVSVFYHKPVHNNMLRFCFAKEKDTLEKAAERLCKI